MGARKKSRVRFEFQGRYFLWYNDADWYIRIASEDKKFVVAYLLGETADGMRPHLEVIGQEFPGIMPGESRPVRLHVPRFIEEEFKKSLGAFVNALIRWCMDEEHNLKRYVTTVK